MDLQGIPKRAWRARLIEAYQIGTNNRTLPPNCFFFTLGGNAVDSDTFFSKSHKPAPDSELGYLYRHRGFLQPQQYVSVENKIQIHRPNTIIEGPTWIYGDFGEAFRRWYETLPPDYEVGIVSADLMCGVTAALPTMHSIFRTLFLFGRKKHKIVISFNILQANRWRENMGIEFEDVWETIQNDPGMQICLHYGVELIDKFQYENKTVGQGAGNSLLQTLIFTYQPLLNNERENSMSNSKNTKKPAPKTTKTAPKKSSSAKTPLQKKRSEASRKAWVTRKANAKKTTTVKKAK